MCTLCARRHWPALASAALLIASLALAGRATAFRPSPRDVLADGSLTAAASPSARVAGQPLATTFDGPSSCANPGFLTGDTVGDGNPAALYAALCP
ncbi:MAG: hypothetical protein JO318_13050 [Chloroflexi bacterium]|nr:hypothetical protein [Chloroflexota bacterium]